jgi:uncharacterized protein with FMN-binding domain
MKTENELLFENLDERHYTTTAAAVVEYAIFKANFKDVLGYDEQTGGSVALQKGHQPRALYDELSTALILKKSGHTVILLDESGIGKQLDCLVDGTLSEIKLVKTFSYRSLKEDFYEAHKKGAKRIVLTISTETDRITLISVLKRIANNPFVNQINDIFLIFENKLDKCKLSDFK